MRLFDPLKGQWWNAANKREAYYMTLRVHYGMPALEAFRYMTRMFTEQPEFMNDMIGTLQKAIRHEVTV